jgi:hypothetical protein
MVVRVVCDDGCADGLTPVAFGTGAEMTAAYDAQHGVCAACDARLDFTDSNEWVLVVIRQ